MYKQPTSTDDRSQRWSWSSTPMVGYSWTISRSWRTASLAVGSHSSVRENRSVSLLVTTGASWAPIVLLATADDRYRRMRHAIPILSTGYQQRRTRFV